MRVHIRHIASIIIMSAFAAIAAYQQWTLPIDRWLYDHAIALQPVAPPDDILIVAIDDQSIQELGRWPWPRQYHADLVNKLHQANAKAIAFDVIFPDKDSLSPQQDIAFVDAVKNTPSVVLPMSLEQIQFGGQILERLPFDKLARAANKLGHVHIEQDEDGVCRSVFLREGVSTAYWPHLTLAILESINEEPAFLTGIKNQNDTVPGSMLIARDYYNLISFAGKSGTFSTVSYVDVLNNLIPMSTFENKIIFVGRVANGTNDILVTPVGTMPGVELNANIFYSLRNNLLLTPLTPTSQSVISGLAALFIIALLSLLSPRYFLLLTILTALSLPFISFFGIINARQWFPPGSLICAVLLFYPFWNWQRLEKMLHFLKLALSRIETSIQSSKREETSKTQFFTAAFNYLQRLQLVDSWAIFDEEKQAIASGSRENNLSKTVQDLSPQKNNLFSTQSFSFFEDSKSYNAEISWCGDDRQLFDTVFEELKQRGSKTSQETSYHIEVVDKTLLELRRANKIAEYNQNLVDSSINHLPEAVILTNLFGHILQTNLQAQQLWTETAPLENFIQLTKTFETTSSFQWSDTLSDLAFRNKAFSIELTHTESQRIFICQGQRMNIEESPGIMLFSFKEITALRASEKARLETLHFLSHDLRAPMNSVLALVEHAKHQETYDTSLLTKIEHYVHTNLAYSQQFLQLAKAEEIQPKDFYLCNVIEIIDNAIEEVYPTALSKKISFQCNYPDEVSDNEISAVELLGDAQLLERMFINLLSNAIKFSPNNEKITIDILINTKNSLAPQKTFIEVKITDNGIGIAQEKLPLLFNRFSSGSEKNPQGIGLGLQFVKVVCERHNGSTSVVSEPSMGASFTVSLPQR